MITHRYAALTIGTIGIPLTRCLRYAWNEPR